MALDYDGATPLHMAGFSAKVANVQILLTAGAKVNARTDSGYTPLHYAALNSEESVQALLAAGAKITARSVRGETPLHYAAKLGSLSAAILTLLTAGAEAKAKNNQGKTPWDLVQKNEKLKNTEAYWALNDAQYN